MSILIKGMQMPKNCCQCPVNMDICKRGYKYLLKHPELYDNRADDCPLIPVPEHGGLVDADAYRAEMKKRQDACAEWRDEIKSGGGYGTELFYRAEGFLGAMCEAKLTLDKMPTIIPADKGDA